jgi:hypothetical protein
MGVKLRLIYWWTPEWFLKIGLEELKNSTIKSLKELQEENEIFFNPNEIKLKGTIDDRRKTMAQIHNQLVKKLIDSLGYEMAIEKGRNAMFKSGMKIGSTLKKNLGVGNSRKDLILAAKILYKLLGIEFELIDNKNHMTMLVKHCSLSQYYTPEACYIMSAADEGVVKGLNPNFNMKFSERLTEGSPCCRANLEVEREF